MAVVRPRYWMSTPLVKLSAASVDDVAAAAGRASAKAAGVVGRRCRGDPALRARRGSQAELLIIWTITKGSRAQTALHSPGAALADGVAPFLLTPLLMLGGTYLCFEGGKGLRALSKKDHARPRTPRSGAFPKPRRRWTSGAIRTDFILSAEIMVIA